jgi:hypothetical protein
MQANETPKPLPEIFIPQEAASKAIENFLSRKHPLLTKDQKDIDPSCEETKSIWYSKEHIQTWLDEMNHLGANGVRVHFGAYDATSSFAPGQLCLIVNLTRPNKNEVSEDIIYENEVDFSDRSNATPKNRAVNANGLGNGENIKQFNYGSPCPPVC